MSFDWIICCGTETEGGESVDPESPSFTSRAQIRANSEAMATTERSVADKQALVENSVNDSTAPAQVEYVENSVNDSTDPAQVEYVENSVNDSTDPAQVEYVENSVNDSTDPAQVEYTGDTSGYGAPQAYGAFPGNGVGGYGVDTSYSSIETPHYRMAPAAPNQIGYMGGTSGYGVPQAYGAPNPPLHPPPHLYSHSYPNSYPQQTPTSIVGHPQFFGVNPSLGKVQSGQPSFGQPSSLTGFGHSQIDSPTYYYSDQRQRSFAPIATPNLTQNSVRNVF
eukprot:CAMPEP_0194346298 /NCGR_PEP_ID=MMETSP0171-20130528/105346_1 /TAXON_ID=218684 /ORGANISM="Corethron pennatum, Strain L29A3" /LENGTH=278 /DNA_ID=CAMNT_0039113403 /DNA_START=105 /DNA_END=941 /DNA_ORIENTATION=+